MKISGRFIDEFKEHKCKQNTVYIKGLFFSLVILKLSSKLKRHHFSLVNIVENEILHIFCSMCYPSGISFDIGKW